MFLLLDLRIFYIVYLVENWLQDYCNKQRIEGLKDKKISAAGLDVYEEEESYFFEDDSADILQDDVLARLLTFNNVIVTSHQAFFTREALDGIVETTFNNILEYHNKQELTNEV